MSAEPIQQVDAGHVAGRTVTFSNALFFGDVSISSREQDLSAAALTPVVDDLLTFINADWDDGWFGITQQGASWFGHGARTFVETATKQYDELPGTQNTHHREIATWVGSGGPHAEAMILSGQARTKASQIDRFTVGLITDGYPITPQFITALDDLSVEFGNAHDWERPNYTASRMPTSHLAVEDVDMELSRHDTDSQVDELVCRNPFHEQPEELADTLDLHDDLEDSVGICRTLAEYEWLRAHVLTPYYPKENLDGYEIERFEVTDLGAVTAPSVGTVNVRVDVQPNLA
jgi:hypothetical protein